MNLATMVALPAQESKLTDVGAVASCVGAADRTGRLGRRFPAESADDLGSEINDGEEGGQQQQNLEAREEEPVRVGVAVRGVSCCQRGLTKRERAPRSRGGEQRDEEFVEIVGLLHIYRQ